MSTESTHSDSYGSSNVRLGVRDHAESATAHDMSTADHVVPSTKQCVFAVMQPPFALQSPVPGHFDQRDLRWVNKPLTAGPNKGKTLAEAYIPHDRIDDFYQGECLCGSTTYRMAKKMVNQPENLSKPQNNSFLCQKTYACSFGPEDYRDRLPEVLTQQQRPTGSRLHIRGTSRKRGCLSGFTITQLYLWPDIAQISTKHSQHTDSAGNLVHGSSIAEQQVKHNHAPAVSDRMKDWVRIQLLEGHSAQQIMAKHAKSALPWIESGTADRDCYLETQTIRNIAAKHAKFTWKRHPNKAQSVRLFYQEHSENSFIYQEEQSSQPQQVATAQPASSAEHQASRRFMFGWTTPAMLANILQYGNGNAGCYLWRKPYEDAIVHWPRHG